MRYIGSRNQIFGWIVMILGLVLIFFAIAPLLQPVLFGIAGLYLINLGMRLRGLPPLLFFVKTWWFSRTFR